MSATILAATDNRKLLLQTIASDCDRATTALFPKRPPIDIRKGDAYPSVAVQKSVSLQLASSSYGLLNQKPH
jgi:hypothetical protein